MGSLYPLQFGKNVKCVNFFLQKNPSLYTVHFVRHTVEMVLPKLSHYESIVFGSENNIDIYICLLLELWLKSLLILFLVTPLLIYQIHSTF